MAGARYIVAIALVLFSSAAASVTAEKHGEDAIVASGAGVQLATTGVTEALAVIGSRKLLKHNGGKRIAKKGKKSKKSKKSKKAKKQKKVKKVKAVKKVSKPADNDENEQENEHEHEHGNEGQYDASPPPLLVPEVVAVFRKKSG